MDRLLPIAERTRQSIAREPHLFGCRELAGTAHGLATAGLGGAQLEPLWDAIAKSGAKRISTFTPRELATTAWSFGKRRSVSLMAKDAPNSAATDALFAALAAQSVVSLSGFTPQGLANLAWAFASAGQQPRSSSQAVGALFDALAAACARRADALKPRELAMVAWAYASLGRIGGSAVPLAVALARSASARLESFSGRELGMMGWSFAIFDVPEASEVLFGASSPFAQLAEEKLRAGFRGGADGKPASKQLPSRRDASTLTQLHQWSLYRAEVALRRRAASDGKAVQDDGGGGVESGWDGREAAGEVAAVAGEVAGAVGVAGAAGSGSGGAGAGGTGSVWPSFSSSFQAICRNTFFAEPVPMPSALEASVQAALAHMGLSTQHKVRTAEEYMIDLLAESSGGRRQVAIEVDGPSRFVAGQRGSDARGSSVLKRRQLRSYGYRLMSIPYWEWEELQDLERQSQYLALAFAVRIGLKIPFGERIAVGGSVGGPLLPREGEGAPHRQPAQILPHVSRTPAASITSAPRQASAEERGSTTPGGMTEVGAADDAAEGTGVPTVRGEGECGGR